MKSRYVFALALVLVVSYPASVLAFTWTHVLMSDLEGGRNGPLDAYRHTLASAFVAYTFAPSAVQFVSYVMENNAKRSSAMDRHNNSIGAKIGENAARLTDLQPLVAVAIKNGAINAQHPQQSTWLPKEDWRPGKLW